MRKGGSKSKGNVFERKVCKIFSEWWTKGKRTDVFYRSDSSGGRATARKKQKKTTIGQTGDMAARERRASILTERICFEFKCGYPGKCIFDLIDGVSAYQKHPYFKFLDQVISQKDMGQIYWMLITQRPRKQIIAYMEPSLLLELFYPMWPKSDIDTEDDILYKLNCNPHNISSSVFYLKSTKDNKSLRFPTQVIGLPLLPMLKVLNPRIVEKTLHRRYKR